MSTKTLRHKLQSFVNVEFMAELVVLNYNRLYRCHYSHDHKMNLYYINKNRLAEKSVLLFFCCLFKMTLTVTQAAAGSCKSYHKYVAR